MSAPDRSTGSFRFYPTLNPTLSALTCDFISPLEGLEGDEEMTADTHTYLHNSDILSEPVPSG